MRNDSNDVVLVPASMFFLPTEAAATMTAAKKNKKALVEKKNQIIKKQLYQKINLNDQEEVNCGERWN